MKLETSPKKLSEITGKPVKLLPRKSLEDEEQKLLNEAKNNRVGLLVGGDCLSATTHISLLMEAKKQGIKTKVIHGSSILTAVAKTGLSLYKFGRTVTLPLPDKAPVDTVLRTLKENREYGLHTLVLLDLDIEAEKYLTIEEGLNRLLEHEAFNPDALVVGLARLGGCDSVMKADSAKQLVNFDFGEAPHALIFPGNLHFLEEEALTLLCNVSKELVKNHKVKGELETLVEKYTSSCGKVLKEMELRFLPVNVGLESVEALIDHVKRYLDDAEYYSVENKPVALTSSVAYAEGILDALKLLGIAEFEW